MPGAATRETLRSQDDAAVVAAFLGGEERAFQELVERYQTRLLNFIYRTIGDREKAEDLVQEVFIRVYRHLHRFDRTKKFSTWVYTIASNLAKNELRNRSRNPLVLFQTIKGNWDDEDRPLQFEDTTARPDDMYRKRHLRELVEETVAKSAGASPPGVRASRAGGQVVRGDRRDHGLQPWNGEVAVESRAQRVRVDHRAEDRLSFARRVIEDRTGGAFMAPPVSFSARDGELSFHSAGPWPDGPLAGRERLSILEPSPGRRVPMGEPQLPRTRVRPMDCREFRNKHVAFVDDLLPAVEMEAMHGTSRGLPSVLAARHGDSPQPDDRAQSSADRAVARLHGRGSMQRLEELGPTARVDLVAPRPHLPSAGALAALAAGVVAVAYMAIETTHYFSTAAETLPVAHDRECPGPRANCRSDRATRPLWHPCRRECPCGRPC